MLSAGTNKPLGTLRWYLQRTHQPRLLMTYEQVMDRVSIGYQKQYDALYTVIPARNVNYDILPCNYSWFLMPRNKVLCSSRYFSYLFFIKEFLPVFDLFV